MGGIMASRTRLKGVTTLVLLIALAGLIGCGGSATKTPSVVPGTIPTTEQVPTVESGQPGTVTPFTSPLEPPAPTPFSSPLPENVQPVASPAASEPAAAFELSGKIAFHSERSGNFEIWVMNVDGSDPVQLTDDPELDDEPSWSPDGKQIVFVTSRDDPLKLSLYVMNADGSDQHELVRIEGGLCMGPAWSPDGARIAFFSNVDGNFELYMVNADGSELTNLSNNAANDSRPAWSPDGKKLAFVSDRDEGENIYTLDLDSGSVVRLTSGYYADNLPRWSPDGSTIVFASDRAGIKGLYTVKAEGGEPAPALIPAGNDDSPAWTSDGRYIIFSSDRVKNWELYIVPVGGTDVRQLTTSDGYDRFPDYHP